MKSIFKISLFRFFFFLFLLFSSLLIFHSCSDEQDEISQQIEPHTITQATKRTPNNDLFYDQLYVYDLLNIQSNRTGTYPFVDDVMAFLQNHADSESMLEGFRSENIFPCWNCSEPEIFDYSNYYIPFYDLDDARLKGILIAQERENAKSFYYLSKSLVTQIVSVRTEPYSQYWHGIMEYFDLDSYPNNRDVVFASMTIPCTMESGVCGCGPDRISCTFDDFTSDPPCHKGRCPSGIGGDGSGTEKIDIWEFYDWVHGDDNGGGDITGGNNNDNSNNSGSGGNNNNNSNSRPDWNENCDSFDGSFSAGTILEEGGETVLDESTGLIALDELEKLYEMQVTSFINEYNLPYTPQELMALAGEKCAVSNATQVKTCLKCYFISPLGLSSQDSWSLAEDFDIVAECETNPSPNCIECKFSIKEFENDYNVKFSPEEENYIINNAPCANYANFADYILEAYSSVYEDPDNGFICKSSFDNYTPTGDGATIHMECNKLFDFFIILDIPPSYTETCYDTQDLCITTGMFELDEDGDVIVDDNGIFLPIGMNIRKELTAQAYSAARYAVFNENKSRLAQGADFLSQTEADILFRNTLVEELEKKMTGVSVSIGSCEGSIGTGRPMGNNFGICLPSFCKC